MLPLFASLLGRDAKAGSRLDWLVGEGATSA
jgi:hypothetical protein